MSGILDWLGLGGGAPSSGILASATPAPAAPSPWAGMSGSQRFGLFGAALKDAGASLDGKQSDSLTGYLQQARQQQIQQLLAATQSKDPAVRQQAYSAYAAMGGNPKPMQDAQASAALPRLLNNMQPDINPVQVTAPVLQPNLPQLQGGTPLTDPTRQAAYNAPTEGPQPTLAGALSTTNSPELSAQMAPEIIKQQMEDQDKSVTTLTPKELTANGFNPSSVVQRDHFGNLKVAQAGEKQNPNQPFNADGTANKPYQDYQINLAKQTALARAKVANGPAITGSAPGTLGAPQIDVTAPGYSREVVPNAGGLTQSAIDQAALSLATTGKFPSGMGIGSTGAGGQRKNAIQNRAGELNAGGNIAANAAQLKALTASLTQQTNYANSTERSVTNAENGFKQVVTAFNGKVNDSSLPIVNAITNAAKYQLSPGDISAFKAGLTEVANEYSNVFSRGGIVTDAVRAQAKQIADGNLSIADLNKVFSELQAQGNIVISGSHAQVQKLQGQLNGIISGAAPPAAQQPQQNTPPPPQDLPRTKPSTPAGLPAGSMYSPSRQQYRDPSGKIYDKNGKPL